MTAGEWFKRAGKAVAYCVTTGAAAGALDAVATGTREPESIGTAAAVGFLTCMVGLLKRSPMPSQGGEPVPTLGP